jgi:hypothetical protein
VRHTMRDRLGRSCPDPIGGQALGGGALTMPIRVLLVTMYYSRQCWLSTWCWGEWSYE